MSLADLPIRDGSDLSVDVEHILELLPQASIAVIGDFCLDAYWERDDASSEVSLETGLPTRPVVAQRYSLGGAGNVVANVCSLGVGRVLAFGVVGADPFGGELLRLLGEHGADATGVLRQAAGWNTPVYIKPILEGDEESRLDFGHGNALDETLAARLAEQLAAALPDLDAVIVNEQLRYGIHTPALRRRLQALSTRASLPIVLDARHLDAIYDGCLLKINEHEAAALCAGESVEEAAARLRAERGQALCITRGANGCLVADAHGLTRVPGLHIVNQTDAVGAGDSLVAGFTAALAVGQQPAEAAVIGNFVAGVTVQKLLVTGCATPAEVLAIGTSPDYIYAPDIADAPHRAVYVEGTEIEQIAELGDAREIRYAIFDHDGTISALRQGWEAVMEPMMMQAILGSATVSEALRSRVSQRVRAFINQTTGVQTISQMEGLARLVREFDLVPADAILDAAAYKARYLQALMQPVRQRLEKLRRGELAASDLVIKGAPACLRRLHEAGVRLYLASGTDEADVIAEAEALGYAERFEGRIFGAVGDTKVEAKRMVLNRILGEIGEGGGQHIVTFGDGPVEIRETRKRGGLAVGIASDEVRRYGHNPDKRARLIRAGAHLLIPDFSQLDALLQRLPTPA